MTTTCCLSGRGREIIPTDTNSIPRDTEQTVAWRLEWKSEGGSGNQINLLALDLAQNADISHSFVVALVTTQWGKMDTSDLRDLAMRRKQVMMVNQQTGVLIRPGVSRFTWWLLQGGRRERRRRGQRF